MLDILQGLATAALNRLFPPTADVPAPREPSAPVRTHSYGAADNIQESHVSLHGSHPGWEDFPTTIVLPDHYFSIPHNSSIQRPTYRDRDSDYGSDHGSDQADQHSPEYYPYVEEDPVQDDSDHSYSGDNFWEESEFPTTSVLPDHYFTSPQHSGSPLHLDSSYDVDDPACWSEQDYRFDPEYVTYVGDEEKSDLSYVGDMEETEEISLVHIFMWGK